MRIGILGSTGLVGRQMITCLQEHRLPITELRLFAHREVGVSISCGDRNWITQRADEASLAGLDVLLIATDAAIAKQYAPLAMKANATVIDNSSAFRMNDDVPLVVPQINASDIRKEHALIANPNCSTILAAMAIAKADQCYGITHMVVSTYQAVSGAGKQGMEALEQEIGCYPAEYGAYPAFGVPIINNVIPKIGVWDAGGQTSEENKMMRELGKILHHEIPVTCTCVRVPVIRCHSLSITFWIEADASWEDMKNCIASMPQVRYLDALLAMPILAGNQDEVMVCRLRQSAFDRHEFTLWCCFDQLRKGAAANAVEILELLVERWPQS